jgi:hypothetical protein
MWWTDGSGALDRNELMEAFAKVPIYLSVHLSAHLSRRLPIYQGAVAQHKRLSACARCDSSF